MTTLFYIALVIISSDISWNWWWFIISLFFSVVERSAYNHIELKDEEL